MAVEAITSRVQLISTVSSSRMPTTFPIYRKVSYQGFDVAAVQEGQKCTKSGNGRGGHSGVAQGSSPVGSNSFSTSLHLADIIISIVHSSSVSKDLPKTRLHHPANQSLSPSPPSKTLIPQHTTYGSSLPLRSQPTSDQQPWSPSCSQVSCSPFGLQSCDRESVI